MPTWRTQVLRADATVVNKVSTSSVVDIYECATRVVLSKSGIQPSDTVDPLVSAYGEGHEQVVVEQLSANVDFVSGTLLEHCTPVDYTQARIETEQFSLRPDFLFTPSSANLLAGTELDGDNMVVPADAKAARTTKPSAILQITLYGLALHTLGYTLPPVGLLFLGAPDGFAIEVVELSRYYLLVEKLLEKFRHTTTLPLSDAEQLYGDRKPSCDTCRYATHCNTLRAAADDVSMVANITKHARVKLASVGVESVAALVGTDQPPESMNTDTFFAVRNQAKLQKMAQHTPPYQWWGPHSGHPNGPEAMQFPHFLDTPVTVGPYLLGTAKHPDSTKRLPAPDAGDIFFDFEGFPFHPSGALEYLFGWVSIVDDVPVFDFLWANTEGEEKSAFEKFVTFLLNHFHKFPNAHVYHYAPYEVTALRRLANKYGVLRDETHTLIDGGKFVDLYAVVKQSMQIGVGSYSIKKIEPMFGFHPRTADVASAMASVQVYDSYVKKYETDEGEAQLLKNSILEYNEDDCVSTYVLFRWLNSHRDEALAHVPQTVLDKVPYESSQKNVDTRQRCVSLKEQLKQVGTAQALMLVDCVDYYISEEGVQYFSQFDQLNNPTVDTCVLTGMDVVAAGPRTNSRSAVMLHHTGKLNVKNTFTILSASHFVGAEQVSSSVVEEKFGVRVTPEPGQFLALLNASKAADAIAEHAVCVDGVVRAGAKQEALFALCDDVVAGKNIGVAGALLSKCTGVTLPHGSTVDDNIAQATAMLTPGTYFAVQGPPGAGKTYMGVAVVQEALQLGYSVGVCSVSHKAVENLLTGLVKKDIQVVKHSTAKPDPDAKFSQMRIDTWVEDPSVGVCGGTVFAFAALGKKPNMAHMVDLLVIDEASQMSVVDALAAVRCAKRVVLLGDPAQLPHVAQATHEGVAQHSILGHLVSGHTIIPGSQGYFLPTTFRFGPDLAVPVSQLAYEGKLSSAVPQRHVDTLAGVYRKFVPSVGCEQSNVVEAHTCADIVTTLVGSPCGDAELTQEDIVVVAPYNDMVRLVKDTFAENGLSQVRVGTVDSFQGQQCLVVLFALTASSDVGGRGASFVLDVARLNVSLSRAVAVAVVVGAPNVASGVSLSVDGLNVAATCAFVDSLPVLPPL